MGHDEMTICQVCQELTCECTPSRITREEAKKLAYLAEQSNDWSGAEDAFACLDEMFPEWAPFKHALCHPCEGCGDPIRHGTRCDKCYVPAYSREPYFLTHKTLMQAYADLLRVELNRQTPLMEYFDGGKEVGYNATYYTTYDYWRKKAGGQ